MNTGRFLGVGLVAVSSLAYFRQNRRRKIEQECVDVFGFPPSQHPLTRRQRRKVQQVVQEQYENCRRLRRLVLAYSQARPDVARTFLDDYLVAYQRYNRTIWLKQRIWR